ncbi:hypothetical protein ACQ4PT_027696 [Festuca glaucescens]
MGCAGIAMNTHVCNTMLHVCAKARDATRAQALMMRMDAAGVPLDHVFFDIVCGLWKMKEASEAPSSIGSSTWTWWLRGQMEARGMSPSFTTYNAIIRKIWEESKMKEGSDACHCESEKQRRSLAHGGVRSAAADVREEEAPVVGPPRRHPSPSSFEEAAAAEHALGMSPLRSMRRGGRGACIGEAAAGEQASREEEVSVVGPPRRHPSPSSFGEAVAAGEQASREAAAHEQMEACV